MRTPVLATTAAGIMLAASGCGSPGGAAATAAPEPVTIAVHEDDCTAEDVRVTAEDGDMLTTGGEYFENVRVSFRNTGETACTIDGHPAAHLTGPAAGRWKSTFTLPPSGAPARVTLAPGETAHATIRVHVLPGASDLWQPSTLTVTLPGSTTPTVLPWPSGLAISQDATPAAFGYPNSIEAVTAGR
jgi:hypothetical protein